MSEKQSDGGLEDAGQRVNDEGGAGEGLFRSPIGLEALEAAKEWVSGGVPFHSAVRHGVFDALDRAGASKDEAPKLEARLVSEVAKQMLRPAIMKLIAPGDMTLAELVGEIQAAGFDESAAPKLAAELYDKRARLREVATAKIKAKVLERVKESQTEAQQELMGRVLDEMFKGGVPSVSGDCVAAWERVAGGGKH